MRPWVTISGVKEAITAKDIVKLQTYLPEVWSWFQRNICDPLVTWNEKCSTSLSNGVRDENVNKAVRWCYYLEIQGWRHGLFMFWSSLKTCLIDHGFLMSLEIRHLGIAELSRPYGLMNWYLSQRKEIWESCNIRYRRAPQAYFLQLSHFLWGNWGPVSFVNSP